MSNKELAVANILNTILDDYKGDNASLLKLKSKIKAYVLMKFNSDIKNYTNVTYFALGVLVDMIEDIEDILKTDEDIIKFCRKLLALAHSNSIIIDSDNIEKENKINNITTIINEKLSTLG